MEKRPEILQFGHFSFAISISIEAKKAHHMILEKKLAHSFFYVTDNERKWKKPKPGKSPLIRVINEIGCY